MGYSNGYSKKLKRCAWFCMCVMLSLMMMPQMAAADKTAEVTAVDPVTDSNQYSAVVYDNASGLPTVVANDIVQTDDGFIWIASYGGLIRYDSNDFERINSKKVDITGVGCMFVDSTGRLWIGTNDDGIAVMEKGDFRWWNEDQGLKFAKVRAITEGKNGAIYVGTISGICMIDSDGQLKKLEQPEIANVYVEQMQAGSDGTIYCVSSEGDYFTIKGDKLASYTGRDKCTIKNIISLLPNPNQKGMIYIGTEGSTVYHCEAKSNPAAVETIDVSPLSNANNLVMINDNLWVCAPNGIGMIDKEGFHYLPDLPLTASVTDVIEDYEGNLWFASSRQGVMKVTPNHFLDYFKIYDIPEQVVNSTCMSGEELFVGMEAGLIVIGKEGLVSSVPVTEARYASGKTLQVDDLLSFVDDCRIRSIIEDSKGRLWISTWKAKGLLRFDHGKLTVFDESAGLPSDRVRAVHETDDGSMVVAVTGGICVIEGDRVTTCYDEKDGIETIEPLTVSSAPNGDIIDGSNGGGIYIIGKKGVRCINRKDGLTSNVVMRVKYDSERDLFWIITGNSIAYMTRDYKITTIKNLPYSDNLDLYENSREEMWVLSSDGIYVVPTEEMVANEEINFNHYGSSNGFEGTPVSNSYSYLMDNGDLYIATNTGVTKVNIDASAKDYSDIKQAIPFIDGDNERYYPDENGKFTIPSSVKKLTIYGFVFNYSLTDPMVSCRLEGFDRNDMLFRQSDLHPIVYTNLSGGTYRYTMTLKDDLGNTNKTTAITIVKQKALYEQIWFYVLNGLFIVALMYLLSRLYVRKKMQKVEERHRKEAEQQRVNNELQTAHRIQMSTLPHEFPPFPDRHEFDIYATTDPAREVGGDFYDFYMIDDDHLCVVIADVSGKGIPAALYMMNSKMGLQIIAKTGASVEEILNTANNTICQNNQLEMFVTAWLGILEISTGKFVASNAGHEYPAIKHADGAFKTLRDHHCFVLGGMENVQYKSYELQLQPGDKIFVYTDGLVEAIDADLNMFGADRMLAALNTEPDAAPEALLKNVHHAVDVFVKDAEQFDDMTMLCLEYKGTEIQK